MATLAKRLADRGLPLIAQRVETHEVFEWTREAGCTLFQGRYFCEPQSYAGSGVATQAAHLRLLSALNQPRITMDELEELVKQDAVLSLRVLQCINSAAFAIRREVRSIREALVFLGMGPIRKWASVWCLAKLNVGSTSELATMAMLRARACELLAARFGRRRWQRDVPRRALLAHGCHGRPADERCPRGAATHRARAPGTPRRAESAALRARRCDRLRGRFLGRGAHIRVRHRRTDPSARIRQRPRLGARAVGGATSARSTVETTTVSM